MTQGGRISFLSLGLWAKGVANGDDGGSEEKASHAEEGGETEDAHANAIFSLTTSMNG